MTEDDQDLLERIEGLIANAWDDDEHETLIEARDRIQALIAENERLANAIADRLLGSSIDGKTIKALVSENKELSDVFMQKPKAWLITDDESYLAVTALEPDPRKYPYCDITPLFSKALGETK